MEAGDSHADGKPTVLVAEDHADSREALSALLEAFGYRVIVAVNGKDAVQKARRYGPDIILMDLMMPELDGFEATRTLRRDPVTRDTPIIALTALGGARKLALDAGVNHFVAKPVDSASLMDTLRLHLEAG